MTHPDELAEPYAQIAHQGRFAIRRKPKLEVLAWLTDRMQMVAAAQGRRVSTRDWVTLVMVLFAAVPDDKDWEDLTAWAQRRQELGGPDTPATIAHRRAELDEALRGRTHLAREAKAKAKAEQREAVGRMSSSGMSVRQIADTLGLSQDTVKRHRKAIQSTTESEAA